ncbi:MAG: hypothetical protein AB7V61_05090 [Methylocystis sp.]
MVSVIMMRRFCERVYKTPCEISQVYLRRSFGFLRPNSSAIRKSRTMRFTSPNRRRFSAAVNIRPPLLGQKARRNAA